MQGAGSPLGRSTYCFKYASFPRGLGSEACLAHSSKGASPLGESPRRGRTPFGTPRRSVAPPHDSARPFHNAIARFRHELPWILRVPESGESGEPKLVYLVYLVYVVCLVGRNENGFIWFVRLVSFNGLADRKTKETRKPDKLNKPEKSERRAGFALSSPRSSAQARAAPRRNRTRSHMGSLRAQPEPRPFQTTSLRKVETPMYSAYFPLGDQRKRTDAAKKGECPRYSSLPLNQHQVFHPALAPPLPLSKRKWYSQAKKQLY